MRRGTGTNGGCGEYVRNRHNARDPSSEAGFTGHGPLDLTDQLRAAFALLDAALRDRAHPCRTPVLATIAPDGAPEARTVVLRGFDAAARRVEVHADARSAKVLALRRDPRAALVFHHPARAVQIRLSGLASLHVGDRIARDAWSRVPPSSRALYAAALPPGAPVAAPPPMPDAACTTGEHFAVLAIVFTQLDWLHLAEHGHRRACFAWAADGALAQRWVVP